MPCIIDVVVDTRGLTCGKVLVVIAGVRCSVRMDLSRVKGPIWYSGKLTSALASGVGTDHAEAPIRVLHGTRGVLAVLLDGCGVYVVNRIDSGVLRRWVLLARENDCWTCSGHLLWCWRCWRRGLLRVRRIPETITVCPVRYFVPEIVPIRIDPAERVISHVLIEVQRLRIIKAGVWYGLFLGAPVR